MLYQAWTKKNAFNQKKKETVPLLLSCSLTVVQVRPPSSNFDVTSLFCFLFPLSCVLCSFILLIWVVSRPCAAYNAQTSHWGALFFSLVLWAFAKHLGCCFPFVCVQCCAFDLCCAQLFPLLSWGASHTLKKPRGTEPEVQCIMRSLACFLLLVFQWEASQTNPSSPVLFYVLRYRQTEND